jgi:hypothetical protein
MKTKLLSCCALLLLMGCGPKLIPGLNVAIHDTPDNRALIKVLDAYRTAYENKNIDGLVAMASKRFYEDSGTADTEDDYNYEGLAKHFGEHFGRIKSLQLTLNLKGIKVDDDKKTARIDYHYVTRYLMNLPAGEKWVVTDESNRMELVKEDGNWKVTSGF